MATRKKKTSKRRRKKQAVRGAGASNPPPPWMWLALGIVLGLVFATVVFVVGDSEDTDETAKSEPPPNLEDEPGVSEAPPERPQYEFYSVLPEMEVVISEDELVRRAEDRQERLDEAGAYLLQAGSFQDQQDAEKRKAELAFLGVVSEIKTVEINQKTWHRIRIGPYTSARELDVVRRQLQENGIDVMVLRQQGEG